MLAELVEQLPGHLVVRVRDDFPRLHVHDVAAEVPAERVVVVDVEHVDARLRHLPDVPRGDPPPGFHEHRAFLVPDVESGDVAAQPVRHELEPQSVRRQIERVEIEEQRQDLLGGIAEGAQENRRRELPAAIDPHVHEILRVELEVEPGSPVRDDPCGEQELARRMRLAPVVLEEHAGRTVKLRDDDALGAVDDEGAGVGHERNLAHVDLLLLDVLQPPLDDLCAPASGLLLVEHQPQRHAQGRGIGLAAKPAFAHVERGLLQPIAHVFERGVSGVALDREDGLERGMKALVLPPVRRGSLLEKVAVGIDLNREQIRHVENARPLAEVLPDALLLGEGVRHELILD